MDANCEIGQHKHTGDEQHAWVLSPKAMVVGSGSHGHAEELFIEFRFWWGMRWDERWTRGIVDRHRLMLTAVDGQMSQS